VPITVVPIGDSATASNKPYLFQQLPSGTDNVECPKVHLFVTSIVPGVLINGEIPKV
jgi:hypothetical protein